MIAQQHVDLFFVVLLGHLLLHLYDILIDVVDVRLVHLHFHAVIQVVHHLLIVKELLLPSRLLRAVYLLEVFIILVKVLVIEQLVLLGIVWVFLLVPVLSPPVASLPGPLCGLLLLLIDILRELLGGCSLGRGRVEHTLRALGCTNCLLLCTGGILVVLALARHDLSFLNLVGALHHVHVDDARSLGARSHVAYLCRQQLLLHQ